MRANSSSLDPLPFVIERFQLDAKGRLIVLSEKTNIAGASLFLEG